MTSHMFLCKINMLHFFFFCSVASKTKFFENASRHVGRYVADIVFDFVPVFMLCCDFIDSNRLQNHCVSAG